MSRAKGDAVVIVETSDFWRAHGAERRTSTLARAGRGRLQPEGADQSGLATRGLHVGIGCLQPFSKGIARFALESRADARRLIRQKRAPFPRQTACCSVVQIVVDSACDQIRHPCWSWEQERTQRDANIPCRDDEL